MNEFPSIIYCIIYDWCIWTDEVIATVIIHLRIVGLLQPNLHGYRIFALGKHLISDF